MINHRKFRIQYRKPVKKLIVVCATIFFAKPWTTLVKMRGRNLLISNLAWNFAPCLPAACWQRSCTCNVFGSTQFFSRLGGSSSTVTWGIKLKIAWQEVRFQIHNAASRTSGYFAIKKLQQFSHVHILLLFVRSSPSDFVSNSSFPLWSNNRMVL